MSRGRIGLGLEVAFFALAFGWRSWVQWRRTGSTGFIQPRRGAPPAELAGAVGFTVSLLLLVAAPVAELAGLDRLGVLDESWVAVVGAVLALVVLVAALQVQVRLVEEPYLRSVHGPAFTRYARRAGRFLPRLGVSA